MQTLSMVTCPDYLGFIESDVTIFKEKRTQILANTSKRGKQSSSVDYIGAC